MKTAAKAVRGIVAAIRARSMVFAGVALGVFALNLFLPVLVLSLARRPVDSFTFNPWLSRLPEWLASGNVSITRKFEFLSTLALAWFSAEADNPTVGREWGFVVDVPSLVRFIFTSLVFGAYFATWGHLADVRSHEIAYDAQTTLGGSGGPILGTSGRVIGVNYAFARGFKGASFGVPIRFGLALLPGPGRPDLRPARKEAGPAFPQTFPSR